VRSVQLQTVPVRHIVVADGSQYLADVTKYAMRGWQMGNHPLPAITSVPDNTGKDLWNGHKIYAHYAQLLDTDFLALLDEDNEYLPHHIESLVERADKYGFAWSYRNIYLDGRFVGKDVKESIGLPSFVGYNLVDTSSWMFARRNFFALHGILHPWSGDRTLTETVKGSRANDFFSACTGQHTLNYHAPTAKADFYRSICE
jgi:hypothetical protein